MKAWIISMLAIAALAEAGTPVPAQVVYGRVRDSFGFPYADSGRIAVKKGAVECASATFSSAMSGGLNFRLMLDMDSGGTPYDAHAVQTGDSLALSVEIGGVAQPLIPTNRLTAGTPGSTLMLDLVTGTDADGDGLPDEWERLLCDQSNGRLAGIQSVNPNDDFDGDGLSNADEFSAGTFAFIATDVLKVGGVERVGNRLKLRFLTSQGIRYSLIATDSLSTKAWYPLRFASGETEPVAFRDLVGDGAYKTVYIETTADSMFIRLTAQNP